MKSQRGVMVLEMGLAACPVCVMVEMDGVTPRLSSTLCFWPLLIVKRNKINPYWPLPPHVFPCPFKHSPILPSIINPLLASWDPSHPVALVLPGHPFLESWDWSYFLPIFCQETGAKPLLLLCSGCRAVLTPGTLPQLIPGMRGG